jgi:tRNA pseudouridine55 synthase
LNKAGEGFLTVDKPSGITSFSVVADVRRRFGGVKTGHAGTLDPAASGLLVLALGNATRLLPFIPLEPKLYRFGVSFGTQTDSLDVDGNVIRSGGPVPSAAAIEAALPGFTGALSQVPPAFSAVKVGGVRAYRLARQGRQMELARRRITIFSLSMFRCDAASGQSEFEVSCSGGTYIRSLARDIAESLGTCGYASSVRRLAAGDFHVDRALPFTALERAGEGLLSINHVLRSQPRISVDAVQKKKLEQGVAIVSESPSVLESAMDERTVFAFDDHDNLVAVLKRKADGRFHPVRVFLQ